MVARKEVAPRRKHNQNLCFNGSYSVYKSSSTTSSLIPIAKTRKEILTLLSPRLPLCMYVELRRVRPQSKRSRGTPPEYRTSRVRRSDTRRVDRIELSNADGNICWKTLIYIRLLRVRNRMGYLNMKNIRDGIVRLRLCVRKVKTSAVTTRIEAIRNG